jgi:hypothetical protein
MSSIVLYLPYTLILGNGTSSQQIAPTVMELSLSNTAPTGPSNVVLTQQFGAFAPGVYQWSPFKQKWIFMFDYAALCAALFSIASAYICLPNVGATVIPIGASGDAIVKVTRNGAPETNFTLNGTGVVLSAPASVGDVFFIAQQSPLKPSTLIIPGGIPEAPSNGLAYVRENAGWSTLSSALPSATTSTVGVVSIGENLTVDSSGRLSAVAFNPEPATTTTLGGVIVGANLTVDANGVLSGTPHVGPANTTAQSGPVAVQGSAATFMRSDAAPAINLAATYAWTGNHTFSQPVQMASVTVTGNSQLQSVTATTVTAAGVNVGTTSITNGSITVGALNSETVVNSASLTTDSATIGSAAFSGTVTSVATQPSAGDASTLIPTTAWVQSAIVANPGALPIASATVLGGIKVGVNLSIAEDGTLSATESGGGGVPANPTATVGLTTINGVASTFMRSDGAPALSQAIAPTWSQQHTFQVTPVNTATQPGTADATTKMPTTSWVQSVVAANAYTLPAATTTTLGGVIVGENLNVDSNGVLSFNAILDPAAPSALVGLTPVTGVATTYISSDSSPALDQSIAPTWTGHHTFISNMEVGGAASLTISGSQSQQLIFDGPSASARATKWTTAGIERWRVTMSNSETGSNVGSDYQLFRFSDAGAFLDTSLSIQRSTGIASFSQRPLFNGNLAWDAGNFTPANYAPIASPALTGTPTAPTGTPGDASTQIATDAFVANAVSGYLPLTGGTLTGSIKVSGTAGVARMTLYETNGVARWSTGTDVSTESGNNSGSNWVLQSYSDAGEDLNTVWTISRSTGQVQFDTRPMFGTNTPWDGGNFNPAQYATLASPALTGVPTAPTATAGTNSTQLATTAYVLNAFASPALSGVPTAPTATTGTNSTQIATTAYVENSLVGTYAPLASPALTGTPTAPNPTYGNSSGQIATTSFVQTAVSASATRSCSSASTTITISDYYIGVKYAGACAIALNAGISFNPGQRIIIKDESGAAATNHITITANGTDKIDGQSSVTISTNYGVVHLIWNSVTDVWSVI